MPTQYQSVSLKKVNIPAEIGRDRETEQYYSDFPDSAWHRVVTSARR